MGAANKRIPRWMLDAEMPLLEALFSALMAGDGDADGGRYSTSSKGLADDVQELALRLGFRAWVGETDGMYRVLLSRQTQMDTRRESRWIEHYAGRVYDVTLPRNHILMVRRNGKACWSGNCGSWNDGKEKSPAALCRKVAEAKLTGNHQIEIWGDGEQRRSYCFIEDCLEGTLRLMASDHPEPLNIGSDRLVSVNELVSIIEGIAGVSLERRYDVTAAQGVRGRNSDNTLCKEVLGWEPRISLEDGLGSLYFWIESMVRKSPMVVA